MENELKACPFNCTVNGRSKRIVVKLAEANYYVRCETCGARGPEDTSEDDAREVWNYLRSLSEPSQTGAALRDVAWALLYSYSSSRSVHCGAGPVSGQIGREEYDRY